MADYLLSFTVIADSRLDAIAKATALLRSGLRLNGVHSAEPIGLGEAREGQHDGLPGFYWKVVLNVWEDG